MPLRDWILGLFDRTPRTRDVRARSRGPATHVIILDGTMSRLEPGFESNAGLTYKLLKEAGHASNLTLYYEAGLQWRDWSSTTDVMIGRGINRQIKRAYGVLATRYRPGDRIVLIGFSRGAYAVRSLAGVIGHVGLVRSEFADVRTIRQAYRHYQAPFIGAAAGQFRAAYCHRTCEIEAVAVWDTVKALGFRWPLLWRFTGSRHDFHDDALGSHVRHGFHALALDETRNAFAPVLWKTPERYPGRVEQVWFRGTHGDIGGQLTGFAAARPLANIALTWMLDRLEACDVPLPADWRGRFPTDVTAPSVGTWRGWGKIFLHRHRRRPGRDPSERLHESVPRHRLWPDRDGDAAQLSRVLRIRTGSAS